MSDDEIVGLIIGIALMFLGTGVAPMLGGRRGQVFSFVLALVFLVVALNWSNIKGEISAPLHASLANAASNAYVWLGMLGCVWIYFASYSLTSRAVSSRISQPERAESEEGKPSMAPSSKSFAPTSLKEMLAQFKERTDLEGAELVAPNIGKWTTFSGVVFNVSSVYNARLSKDDAVSIATKLEVDGPDTIVTNFNGEKWLEQAKTLRKDDNISITAPIQSIKAGIASLENGEFRRLH